MPRAEYAVESVPQTTWKKQKINRNTEKLLAYVLCVCVEIKR